MSYVPAGMNGFDVCVPNNFSTRNVCRPTGVIRFGPKLYGMINAPIWVIHYGFSECGMNIILKEEKFTLPKKFKIHKSFQDKLKFTQKTLIKLIVV